MLSADMSNYQCFQLHYYRGSHPKIRKNSSNPGHRKARTDQDVLLPYKISYLEKLYDAGAEQDAAEPGRLVASLLEECGGDAEFQASIKNMCTNLKMELKVCFIFYSS